MWLPTDTEWNQIECNKKLARLETDWSFIYPSPQYNLKQKYIIGKSTNKSSGDDSGTSTSAQQPTANNEDDDGRLNSEVVDDGLDNMNKEGDDDETEGSLLVEPPSGHVAHTPLDIAKGLEDTPVQPQNIDFPKDKKNGRSFSSSWFHKHMWLEYSVSRDAAFCYPCRFFSTCVRREDDCFITTGYRNWKNATGMSGRLMKHSKSQRHITASAAWADFKCKYHLVYWLCR